MKAAEVKEREAQRQALLGQLKAAESALRANVDLNCFDVTARMHMQRALVHVQEATVALNGVRRARTVWQLVEDLTKCRRALDEVQSEVPPHLAIKPTR